MTLFLLPNLLGPISNPHLLLPSGVDVVVAQLDGLIAESEQGGRSFLKRFKTKKKPHLIPLALLKKEPTPQEADFLLEPIKQGENWGLISDAGLPCIADPGALLVWRARQKKIPIQALPGPCSITQALMLSGISRPRFAFHGYIAKEKEKREKELREWEKRSVKEGETQLFIEAPFRNLHTYASCLQALSPSTLLCIAWDLTLPSEGVITQPIRLWKEPPPIQKTPAIFLFAVYS